MRPISICFGVVVLAICQGSGAQQSSEGKLRSGRAAAAGQATRQADDAKAIAALVASFTKAFNAGDAAAAAATFAEDALVVDEQGERTEGRAAIRPSSPRRSRTIPAARSRSRYRLAAFPRPRHGTRGGPDNDHTGRGRAGRRSRRFTVVYVKQDGHWLQSAVRDEHAHDLTPHDHLKELEWLVGDWINESQDAVVHTTCKWTDDGNFLVREFTMKTQGQPVLSGTQRIGWDPVQSPVQDLDLRLRGRLRRRILDAQRRPMGDQGRGRATGRQARVGDEYHHATGQGPDELAVGRPDHRGRRGARGR